MNVVVDANIAIAALDTSHRLHRPALRRCLGAGSVGILNLTRAEALIHPTRLGRFAAADAELDRLGFGTVTLDDAVADRARRLRADHGNHGFPLLDAVVVALGMERSIPVVTGDTKWPTIAEARIEVLR